METAIPRRRHQRLDRPRGRARKPDKRRTPLLARKDHRTVFARRYNTALTQNLRHRFQRSKLFPKSRTRERLMRETIKIRRKSFPEETERARRAREGIKAAKRTRSVAQEDLNALHPLPFRLSTSYLESWPMAERGFSLDGGCGLKRGLLDSVPRYGRSFVALVESASCATSQIRIRYGGERWVDKI